MNTLSGVGVVDKSITVLRAVADQPLALADLASATGIPRATAHRIANALVEHGLLRRDAQQRYDLGGELIRLGHIARSRFPLAEIAAPTLHALGAATGESVQLFVAEGSSRRCITSLPSPHALQWIVPEGALYPLGQGSAGRVLAGESSPRGWIATVAEREPGVASVSAPVLVAEGDVIAAASVSGPIERLGHEPGAVYGDAVAAAARDISRALGADGATPGPPRDRPML